MTACPEYISQAKLRRLARYMLVDLEKFYKKNNILIFKVVGPDECNIRDLESVFQMFALQSFINLTFECKRE